MRMLKPQLLSRLVVTLRRRSVSSRTLTDAPPPRFLVCDYQTEQSSQSRFPPNSRATPCRWAREWTFSSPNSSLHADTRSGTPTARPFAYRRSELASAWSPRQKGFDPTEPPLLFRSLL